MTRRIFKTIFGSAMLVLILSLVMFVSILHRYFEDQVFAEIGSEANYIAQGIEKTGYDYFDGLDSNNRITYIDSDGTVLYDNVADPATMENHSDREEIISALKTGTGTSSRYSSTLSQNTLYSALRLQDNSVIRVASKQATAFSLGLSLLGPITATTLLAVFICLFLSRRLSNMITQPILSLDLENPENCDTYDELAPLLLKIHYQNDTIKQQLKQFSKSQEEFTAITESMSEGFLLIDGKTNLLSYNSSALRLLGAPDAKIGQSVLTLARGESFRKVIDEALSGIHSEALMRSENHCYQLYANGVFHKEQVIGAVIAILDVTEREEREALRREFTANVTHELKTPLTSISGFAEIMTKRMVAPENIAEFAGDIYAEAQRLISLVDDILHLSQLDEGSFVPLDSVDLYTMSRNVLDRLRPSAEKMNVELCLFGDHPTVMGVPSVLDEIVFNLCDNAIKYNKRGGSVNVIICDEDSGITLTVADTGIGIPLADRDRIFERFYRIDKSHSKEIGGTGLGLSIVKHGCASQEISITLDSTVGVGTTITLGWNNLNAEI
ncbi:MAG: ATP-binding protein [Lawsonibacter sp.]|nr:ATP-binding protein [Lawsonibacter sp.]